MLNFCPATLKLKKKREWRKKKTSMTRGWGDKNDKENSEKVKNNNCLLLRCPYLEKTDRCQHWKLMVFPNFMIVYFRWVPGNIFTQKTLEIKLDLFEMKNVSLCIRTRAKCLVKCCKLGHVVNYLYYCADDDY